MSSVTVMGVGFAPVSATTFKFGKMAAPSVNCTSHAECAVVSPPHAAGTVKVKAAVNKSASGKSGVAFTYVPPPR
jgi:hypothetical protein